MREAMFLKHKVENQLRKSGTTFEVMRASKDKFGQPMAPSKVHEFVGLYHEDNSFIQTTSSDTTVIQTNKSPMILCLIEDARALQLNDSITINGNTFTVSGFLNIQELDVIADVSLDEVR